MRSPIARGARSGRPARSPPTRHRGDFDGDEWVVDGGWRPGPCERSGRAGPCRGPFARALAGRRAGAAEKQETAGWTPARARSLSSRKGVVSAVSSAIAVQAGVEALRAGGTAADAAATVALTEIATQLGSVVSYAGIMSLVYYDAKTGKGHVARRRV